MPQDSVGVSGEVSEKAASRSARRLQVSRDMDGQRLDNFLLRELNIPRARVYRVIRKGEVRVNGGRAKPMQKLRAGDEIRVPPIRDAEQTDSGLPPAGLLADFRASLLFKADGLRVINKLSGWASQPGSGVRWSLVELSRSAWGEAWQPAHRLDRATSGCLAIVEGREAFNAFAESDWGKTYWALVHGEGPAVETHWEDLLYREPQGRVIVTDTANPEGKQARSRVRTLATASGRSLLEIQLETGRMHQIRVQAASRGLPLIGDDRYGNRALDTEVVGRRCRLALHSRELTGHWPGQDIRVTAPPDDAFLALLSQLNLAP